MSEIIRVDVNEINITGSTDATIDAEITVDNHINFLSDVLENIPDNKEHQIFDLLFEKYGISDIITYIIESGNMDLINDAIPDDIEEEVMKMIYYNFDNDNIMSSLNVKDVKKYYNLVEGE
jgi:hypothetical protein